MVTAPLYCGLCVFHDFNIIGERIMVADKSKPSFNRGWNHECLAPEHAMNIAILVNLKLLDVPG
jgi:hypothetical protein